MLQSLLLGKHAGISIGDCPGIPRLRLTIISGMIVVESTLMIATALRCAIVALALRIVLLLDLPK